MRLRKTLRKSLKVEEEKGEAPIRLQTESNCVQVFISHRDQLQELCATTGTQFSKTASEVACRLLVLLESCRVLTLTPFRGHGSQSHSSCAKGRVVSVSSFAG